MIGIVPVLVIILLHSRILKLFAPMIIMQDVKNKYRYLPKKENPQMTPERSQLFTVLCVQFKMLASLPVEMTSRCMGRATPLPKPAFFTGTTATFKDSVLGLLALIMHHFLTSVAIS